MDYNDIVAVGKCSHVNAINHCMEASDKHFGTWSENVFDLGHIRIGEIRTSLVEEVRLDFKGSTLGEHVHHCMSLGGRMAANFEEWSMTAAIDSSQFHSLYVPGSDYSLHVPVQMRNIHVEIDKSYYASLLGDTEPWSVDLREKILRGEVTLNGADSICAGMNRIVDEIFNHQLEGHLQRLLIDAKVHELIALQLHAVARRGRRLEVKPAKNEAELFCAIREYLQQNFLEPHSLQSICRAFAINEFKLKKGFRAYFHTTVFDYLLNLRLNHARQLLLDTDYQVREVASIVGYKNANHFSTAFKKQFGASPATLKV